MPSTLVHVAFAGLIAAALLGEAYDRRALAVVLAITAAADLDVFVGLVTAVGHRTAFHTLVIPTTAGLVLWYDTTRRDRSTVRERWGHRGVRIAWVSIAAYAFAAIGLDLFTGRVNPLYPIHDQFYRLDGKILLSSQRGFVQTFVDIAPSTGSLPAPEGLGTASQVHVSSGVDPMAGAEPKTVDRIFPVVRSGWQLLVLFGGTAVMIGRFLVPYRLADAA